MNKNVVKNRDDIKILTEGFLFYDGFFQEVNISYANNSLHLLIKCRDLDEKWLNMVICLSGMTYSSFYVRHFSGYMIFDTLRIIPNAKGEYLLTFDNEDMVDLDDLLTNGEFVFVGKEISYTVELIQSKKK